MILNTVALAYYAQGYSIQYTEAMMYAQFKAQYGMNAIVKATTFVYGTK